MPLFNFYNLLLKTSSASIDTIYFLFILNKIEKRKTIASDTVEDHTYGPYHQRRLHIHCSSTVIPLTMPLKMSHSSS